MKRHVSPEARITTGTPQISKIFVFIVGVRRGKLTLSHCIGPKRPCAVDSIHLCV